MGLRIAWIAIIPLVGLVLLVVGAFVVLFSRKKDE